MKSSAQRGASFDRGCDASIRGVKRCGHRLMLLRQNVTIVEPNKERIKQ
jgi:hypothetical protein